MVCEDCAVNEMAAVVAPVLQRYVYGCTPPLITAVKLMGRFGHNNVVSFRLSVNGGTSWIYKVRGIGVTFPQGSATLKLRTMVSRPSAKLSAVILI
jgi:hypothetical protein